MENPNPTEATSDSKGNRETLFTVVNTSITALEENLAALQAHAENVTKAQEVLKNGPYTIPVEDYDQEQIL